MGLVQTSAPTDYPVSLTEVWQQCHVDSSDDDPALLRYIAAATRYVERFTHQQLITATWRQTFDRFPPDVAVDEFVGNDVIKLRRPPLQSVTSVQYVDGSGDTQTFSSDDYSVDTDEAPGRIILGYNEVWPTTRSQRNSVTITYVAGHGDTPDEVPATLRHAILLLVSHWHEAREPIITGTIVAKVPMSVESLLWNERAQGLS